MTKLEKLKEEIGYTKGFSTCSNCVHFSFDEIKTKGCFGGEYTEHKNMRCNKFNFKTFKTTTCMHHEKDENV